MVDWVASNTEIGELLNSLAQPTKYEFGQQRKLATKIVRTWLATAVAQRLDGSDNSVLMTNVGTLRKKYKINDEEIYGD